MKLGFRYGVSAALLVVLSGFAARDARADAPPAPSDGAPVGAGNGGTAAAASDEAAATRTAGGDSQPGATDGTPSPRGTGIDTKAKFEPTKAPPPDATAKPYTFQVDPIADVAIIGLALGFAGLAEAIISTGELRPQRPVSTDKLLTIDKGAVSQQFDKNASTYSNIGLVTAVGFAVLDPILSLFRDGKEVALVDATLYAQSLSLTYALTDLAKVAIRRPRPSAYVAQAALDAQYGANAPSISDTDSSLSFFSGHAAIVAATASTASYLAFCRAPGTWRPWVTVAIGAMMTAGVSIERVRAGAHFPTDVIAGSIAGAGVGLLVPHLHRHDSTGRAVWIGTNMVPSGVGVGLNGIF